MLEGGGTSRFEIESRAGSGAMGVVYRARDRVTGRPVALKILAVTGELALQRFEREAAVLRDLSHPGIVRYVEHGRTMGGEPFLAMEWLDGEDLGARLERAPMSTREALRLARGAAAALAVAHDRGILHRDLKPSNLFLDSADPATVKVLDFGIALAGHAGARLTKTGATLGTPGYAAPEQVRGDAVITPSADVFSLGCVLYECLSGRPAFVADHPMALLAKVLLFEEPPPLTRDWAGAPRPLVDLLAKMLAKDPTARFDGGAAVVVALDALQAFDETVRMPAGEAAPALTVAEARFVSVVAASGIPESSTGPADAARILPLLAAEYSGAYTALGGDTALIVLSGHAAAGDGAARAARCALAIQSLFPRVRLAVGAESIAGSDEPLGAVFERVADLLDGEPVSMPMSRRGMPRSQGISLDETCAGLLDASFVVSSRGGSHALWVERDIDEHRTLLGKRTRCVGREPELRALEALVDGAFDERTPRVALLTGPPGIGKSRVRVELVRRLVAKEMPIQVWTGRADPTTRGAPFAHAGDLLRRLAGISRDDPPAIRMPKLMARVLRDVAASEAERVAGFLGEIAGVRAEAGLELQAARSDPTLMGDQIHRAFEEFVRSSSMREPVLLVFEDLHFGDYATVRLVDSMLRNVGDHPVFVLGTARPEIGELMPGLWRERNLHQVPIAGLGKRALAELAADALGDAGEGRVEEIARLAKGNAFFAEELIRAAARRRIGETKTLVAMLEARLTELDPEARLLLRAASVFGERFEPAGVLALVGGRFDAAVVEGRIAELCRDEVLSTDNATPRGGKQYVFRHALLREAAYTMLTPEDRERGHRLAAEFLRRIGEPDAARLADHFERGGVMEEAANCFVLAAERALEGNDFDVARRAADRGIQCGATGELRGRLLTLWAEADQWSGDAVAAQARAEEALSLLPVGSSTWRRATTPYLTGVLAQGGEPPSALVRALRALPLSVAEAHVVDPDAARSLGDHLLVVASTAAHLILAEWPRVVAPLLERLERADPSLLDPYPQAAGWVWCTRGLAAAIEGDPEPALLGSERSEAAFLRAGDRRGAAMSQCNVACFLIQLGSYQRAAQVSLDAVALIERMGLQSLLPHALANLGLSRMYAGDLEGAEPALRAAMVRFEEGGDRRMQGSTLCYRSWLAIRQGDPGQAVRLAERAVEVLEGARPKCLGLATLARALFAARGDAPLPARAVEAGRDAVRAMTALGGADEGEGYIRLAEVEVLLADGGVDAARASLEEAHDRLLDRADRIRDATLRQSFLENVEENRATLALAALHTPADG